MRTTERFTDRVDDYAKYRPSYPRAIVAALEIPAGAKVADVGSGTGISTRLLLLAGYEVFAVEPNAAMRAFAERDLGSFPGFHSIDGTAEATTLEAENVSAVVCAQAFHWFDVARAKAEMRRVLTGPRMVCLIWNERKVTGAFLEAYERALHEHGVDYDKVDHRHASDAGKLAAFFDGAHREVAAPNAQRFDREGFIGRALSSSYVPKEGHPKHAGMMRALAELWDAYAKDGEVIFEYETRAFVGKLAPA